MSMPMPKLDSSTGMILSGAFATEAIDSSGEILLVSGADISSFEDNKGYANYEHEGHEGQGREVVGRIVFAKKILSKKDCDTDDQHKFWNEVKMPFIYGIVRLADGAGHEGAKALAAHMRDAIANGEDPILRWSIEGSTIAKEGNRLTKTMCRAVAITKKPCNISATSNILLDPNAPEGFDKRFIDKEESFSDLTEVSKFEDPSTTKLGHGYFSVFDPMSKATEAGSYDAAPGTLTGGAALQREDLGHRRYVTQAKAALRDYDWHRAEAGKEDFKKFLKNYLPEADPSFVDYFADMVDDFRVGKRSMKKAEALPLTAGLMDSIKNHSYNGKKPIRYIVPDATNPRLRGSHKELTESGLTHSKDEFGNVKPHPTKDSESFFDKEFGYLHTPRGSFKVNIPDESFEAAMNSPDVQHAHDAVMKNWKVVNGLASSGQLPPEIIASASLFGAASPAIPTPDRNRLDRVSERLDPSGVMDTKWNEFLDKNPTIATDSVEDSHKLHATVAKLMASNQGDAKGAASILYTAPKDESINIDALRQSLERQAIANGMGVMHNSQPFLSSAGQDFVNDNLPSGYEEGVKHSISGFAPKTLRYAAATMGGGNVILQDPHLFRHLFGLANDRDIEHVAMETLGRPLENSDTYEERVFQPNRYIKKLLWDEPQGHILNDIEQYYKENHPAYKSVVNRFWGGKGNPQALLPASWLHWLALPLHEHSLGMPDRDFGGGTNHGTYWHHVRTILGKYGLDSVAKAESESSVIPLVAAAHNDMYNALGPGAASVFYFHRLVPLVLREAAANGNFDDKDGSYTQQEESGAKVDPKIVKMEQALMTLKKTLDSISDLHKAEKDYTDEQGNPKPMIWGGKHIQPGKATKVASSALGEPGEQLQIPMHVVESGPNHYMMASVMGDMRSYSRVSKDQLNKFGIKIESEPVTLDTDAVVDSVQHTHGPTTLFPEQHELVHGMRFEDEVATPDSAARGINDSTSRWGKAADGRAVYIKGANTETHPNFPLARREALYYNMARDFFGLGKHVPVTTAIRHPKSGKEVAVIEGVPGAKHPLVYKTRESVAGNEGFRIARTEFHPDQAQEIAKLGDSGELDKMAVMNAVMGNTDRHQENIVFGDDGLKLIDHDQAYPQSTVYSAVLPAYMTMYANVKSPNLDGRDALDNMIFHPDAAKWVAGLSVTDLGIKLEKQGMPMIDVETAMRNLARIKVLLEKHPNASKHDVIKMGFSAKDPSLFGGSLFEGSSS